MNLSTLNRKIQLLISHDKPIRLLLSKIIKFTGLSQLIKISRGNYFVRFFPSSLSTAIWIDPSIRRDEELLLEKYLKPGDYVIDIGANIGTITLVAANSVKPNGRVMAIEAHPRIFNYLVRNIKLNNLPNIDAFNLAIGRGDGCIYLSDGNLDDQNFVINSFKNKSAVKVFCKKLDDIVPWEREIALLKIDVEGYEKFVLQGAEQTLRQTRCVYFEVGIAHYRKYNYDPEVVFNILRRNGMQIYRLKNRLLVPITCPYSREKHENLFALRDKQEFFFRMGWAKQ
jgi:FkbM family methyltransferase